MNGTPWERGEDGPELAAQALRDDQDERAIAASLDADTEHGEREMLTARQVLDVIDEVLATESAEARQLWEVLTALRGPDDEDAETKRTYTNPIRTAAFPKTAMRACETWRFRVAGDTYANGASYAAPDALLVEKDDVGHFINHANFAVAALRRMGAR